MKLRPHCSAREAARVVAGAALAFGMTAGCAARTAHPVPLAVLIEGDAGSPALPAIGGLAPHALIVPPPPPPAPDQTSAPISRARKAYAAGELEACRAELASIDVPGALAAGAREAAARALALDAACAWGSQARAAARQRAAQLAAFGLEAPDLAIAPDIEAVIGDAITAAGNARRQPVSVRGAAGARLRVDGRPATCALPCTVDLPPGEHVLAVAAEGLADAHRLVRVPDTTTVELAQPAASPAIAAAQWRARAGQGLPTTDAVGARLLAQLAGDRRIAVLHPPGGRDASATLILDGVPAARVTAPRGDRAALLRELAYDGGVLPRPSVWQRPWLWITVSAIALGSAAAIVAATYHPQRTSLDL